MLFPTDTARAVAATVLVNIDPDLRRVEHGGH
jgi:hypothetical protein